MDVNFDGTCGMDHEIEACGLADIEFAQKEKEFGCMRCGASEDEYCYDQVCKTRLCGQCVEYCRRVTADKQRPIITKCEKNHVLVYLTGPEDWYAECRQCKK